MTGTEWLVLFLGGVGVVLLGDKLEKRHRRHLLARPMATRDWRELAPDHGDEVARFLVEIGRHFGISRACYVGLGPYDRLDEAYALSRFLGDALELEELQNWLRSAGQCPRIELSDEDTLWSVFAASFIDCDELAATS